MPVLKGTGSLRRDAIYWHYPHYHPGGATPYGAEGPLHIARFFGDRYLREGTSEFFSPNFHWAGLKPFGPG